MSNPSLNRTRSSRLAIAVCGLMLAVGVFGVVTSWGVFLVDSEIQTHGARVSGFVLKKETLHAADGDSDHLVTYRFTLPTGQQVVSQRGLSKSRWAKLLVGSELVIVYSPTNPNRNFPEGLGTTSVAMPILFTALFGSLAFLGGAVCFRLLVPREHAQTGET